MIISLLCLIVCEIESVNCESETLRKFDEKREVFWQPGHGPARPGEIGRAHRAARHGKTARGPCLGPEARHEHGSGRHGGPCRHDAGPSRHGPMAIYIRVVRGNAEAQKPNEFASSRFFLLWVRPSAIQTGPNK